MYFAYRGHSVILLAPVAAMLAVLLTDPAAVPVMFTGVFMDKMVDFIKLYLPVFLLGAVFGKMIELSGFSKSIDAAVIKFFGPTQAIISIVLLCAILTYGGDSLFVVVFAVYPFAAEMFRQGNIPKRLIPATIGLGAFTFTTDSLPGTPQIQNINPTTFFKTDSWAAPWLGVVGAVFILSTGLSYLEWQRRKALHLGEGYGVGHTSEAEIFLAEKLPSPFLAVVPLILVAVMNKVLTQFINSNFGAVARVLMKGLEHPVEVQVASVAAIWSIEGALLLGILSIVAFAYKPVSQKFAFGSRVAAMASGGMDIRLSFLEQQASSLETGDSTNVTQRKSCTRHRVYKWDRIENCGSSC